MRLSAILVALLLTLPFLECICSDSDQTKATCQSCNDSSHFPKTSHDCLELVEFFAFQEILQSYNASINVFYILKDVALSSALSGNIEHEIYSWFGKLKPHLALNILQV